MHSERTYQAVIGSSRTYFGAGFRKPSTEGTLEKRVRVGGYGFGGIPQAPHKLSTGKRPSA